MEKEVHHIARGDKGTWCGQAAGWNFLNLDHAAENGSQGNAFVPCPDCIHHALKAMRYWEHNLT
jgi:hypothetical protein